MIVYTRHAWNDNPDPVLSCGLEWYSKDLNPCDSGQILTRTVGIAAREEDGTLVGFVSGRLAKINYEGYGTWVRRSLRRQGIAIRLWDCLIVEFPIKGVTLHVISDRGMTLAKALEHRYDHIKFRIEDCGGRTLRVLKRPDCLRRAS